MATVSEVLSSPARRCNLIAKTDAAVSCPATGNTTLMDIDVSQISRLALEIRVATQALDVFIVQAKVHPDGAYMTILSAIADYTTPAGIVVDASGDLNAIAAATTGWLIIDVLAFTSIRLLASAAVNNASVLVYAGGS